MKRTLVAVFILLTAFSIVMAQTQAATKSQPTTPAKGKPAHKIYKGVIDNVTLADSAKGTKPEVTVTSAQKKKETFLVMTTTTLSDADGKALTLDKLQAGERIRVSYLTTPENVREAISIHILK